MRIHRGKVVLCCRKILGRGLCIPLNGFFVILNDSPPLLMSDTKCHLSYGTSLFRPLVETLYLLRVVQVLLRECEVLRNDRNSYPKE